MKINKNKIFFGAITHTWNISLFSQCFVYNIISNYISNLISKKTKENKNKIKLKEK